MWRTNCKTLEENVGGIFYDLKIRNTFILKHNIKNEAHQDKIVNFDCVEIKNKVHQNTL